MHSFIRQNYAKQLIAENWGNTSLLSGILSYLAKHNINYGCTTSFSLHYMLLEPPQPRPANAQIGAENRLVDKRGYTKFLFENTWTCDNFSEQTLSKIRSKPPVIPRLSVTQRFATTTSQKMLWEAGGWTGA